jgi:hypothetical protein
MPRIQRDLRPIVKAALKAGWRVQTTRRGHLKLRSPRGALVVLGNTPSDRRAYRNARAHLRRAGLTC